MELQELAYQHLKEGIVSGRFPGGMQVRQEYFAELLNMSRMPVRDAIRRLHTDGLVTILPNRTVVVTQMSIDEVLEVFAIRSALERLALRHAAPRLKGEALVEGEELLNRLDRAKDDIELWIARHDAFHEHLYGGSKLPRLLGQISQLRVAVQPYFRMYVEWQHNTELHGYEHDVVLDALKRGDAARAEELIEQHVLGAGSQIADFLVKDRHRRDEPAAAAGRPRRRERSRASA